METSAKHDCEASWEVENEKRRAVSASFMRPLKTNISLTTLFRIGVNLGTNYTSNQ